MPKSPKKKRGDSQDKPHDPYMVFNFTVEIEGLTVGGFSEVTGLNSKIELETYVEGGVNHRVHQFPKYITYPNLVLIRGLGERDDLWKWYEDVTRGKIRLLNGTIMVRDNQQSKLIGWNFKKAYPVAWDGPQLNAGNGVVAFERLELVHRGVYKA